MYREGERVAESLRKQFDRHLAAARQLVEARAGTIAWLRERNGRLRAAVVRATELIASLREKNARLRAEVRDLKCKNAALVSRVEKLEVDLDKLRSTRSVLSKALYGSRSERQKKPGTGRKPYVANGERCITLFEIDVEAYENTIVRSRWRRTCDCASAPREVTAPPVTRLFETTPYGISVWTCMLYERFICCRPLHRVAAWLADMGLTISLGTLADSIKRFVPLLDERLSYLRHCAEAGSRPYERLPFASGRCRSEYNPRLAGSCEPRYRQHLRRDRSRDEGQGVGAVRCRGGRTGSSVEGEQGADGLP